MNKNSVQAFVNLGDESYVPIEAVQKAEKSTKQKVITYLNKLIKKHKEQIELWQRTITFIQS